MSIDRETLGALVRQVWVEKAQELPNPKPSNLLPWEQLDEWNKEVDRCIGERIAAYVKEGHMERKFSRTDIENYIKEMLQRRGSELSSILQVSLFTEPEYTRPTWYVEYTEKSESPFFVEKRENIIAQYFQEGRGFFLALQLGTELPEGCATPEEEDAILKQEQ